jgi:hypothetical protein
MDHKRFLMDFLDYASPKLDTYEQTIYLYLVRHTRLENREEQVIPIESAATRTALGIAKKGARISRDVFRRKLSSLESKGFVKVTGKEYTGTKVRVFLPSEVSGIIPEARIPSPVEPDRVDCYATPDGRTAIFLREKGKCFYCLADLNERNRVIDHIVPPPKGDNSYKNCVAACLQCNSEKGAMPVEDFLRLLYRRSRLRADELDDRLRVLEDICRGTRRPAFGAGPVEEPQ